MYTLKIQGARRSTLAYHRCDSYAELHELMAIYTALGYAPEAMIVEERRDERAA